MLRGGIPLGKLFGISIRLDYSWFIIFALVTWSLVANYFPVVFPQWSLAQSLGAGILASLLFFGSVLAHELMHSLLAQRAGIQVASITLFIFGGVSQLSEEPKQPRDELRMALAGPATSLVLGGIFWAVALWVAPDSEFIVAVTSWLGLINVFLGVFNLIPGFPLDGGRVLRSVLWWRSRNLLKATHTASNVGRAVGYMFIFGGIFFIFQGGFLNGLWLAFIGWFLTNAAVSSYRQLSLQEALQGHIASEVMTRDCPTVAPDLTIDELVNEHVLASGRRCFPVASDGRVLGLITLHNVKAVPREDWRSRTLREAMTPFTELKFVTPTDDLARVMKTMAESDINQVVVVEDNGRIAGIIGRDNLINFINIRGELGV